MIQLSEIWLTFMCEFHNVNTVERASVPHFLRAYVCVDGKKRLFYTHFANY